jgi:hypothetical protein
MMLFVQRAPYDSQTIRQAFADHYLEVCLTLRGKEDESAARALDGAPRRFD